MERPNRISAHYRSFSRAGGTACSIGINRHERI
jgi:hypothetical protein